MNTQEFAANSISVLGNLDLTLPDTELRFEDGRVVRVPTALLKHEQALTLLEPTSVASDHPILVPLIEERLEVGRRTVERGKVRLHKASETYDVPIDELLVVSTWKVERVPRNEVVAEVPAPRQDGTTTIYPLVEERLILTREFVLVEEIYVTQELSERRDTQTVTLRRETLDIECEPTR